MSTIALPIAELKPALTGLGKVINRRSSLPVLSTIRIEKTPDGWTTLTGTDIDCFVTVRLEQPSAGESLSFLVPYDDLLKITKHCTKTDEISIGVKQQASVTLRYPIGQQFAENNVESLPVEDFPPIPEIEGEAFPLPDAVRESIHNALECASTDETRLIINSAYIDVSQKGCHHVVGTNGRHLYSSNSFSLPLKDSIILPQHKFIGWKEFNHDGEWKLQVEENPEKDQLPKLIITSRRWTFITRQIDGIYPNWRQVLPAQDQYASSVQFDEQKLEQVIQTIQRMPCHETLNHTIGVEIKGNAVSLLGKSVGADQWTNVSLPDAKAEGVEIKIFLNRDYLTKALTFGLNRVDLIDPMAAIRFSSEGRQMIIMPIRAAVGYQPAEPTTAEPNGEGAAETVNSEQPAAPSDAAPGERNSMPRQPATNGNGEHSNTTRAAKPALETAVEQVETIRTTIKSAVGGLNDLLDTLKQVTREQKTTDKEVQSVRSTLEKLQSVKL